MAVVHIPLALSDAAVSQTSPSARDGDVALMDDERTIVIRDRRKPNQYTTDNLIAREWLPILRIGDAFFLYSIYLSMANRETESSWSSLRTQAQYLQCGIDLVIRANRLLEICELLYIEPGNHVTSNEYYILEPQPLTPELKERIYRRLENTAAVETSKNWQAWVVQVRKALDRHQSLTSIWAERRARRGGRPLKTVRPQKGEREPQSGFSGPAPAPPLAHRAEGSCEPQSGYLWPTTTELVSHNQRACAPQLEQEQVTRESKGQIQVVPGSRSPDEPSLRSMCCCLGIAPAVVDVLLEKYPLQHLWQQLQWLPERNPRDPAAMWISSVQGNWARPPSANLERAQQVWAAWMEDARRADPDSLPALPDANCEEYAPCPDLLDRQAAPSFVLPGTELDAQAAWMRVLAELRMQMTGATFDLWLQGSTVEDVQDNQLLIRVRDEYAAEWLMARWRTPIERTLSGIVGYPFKVRFLAGNA